MGLSNSLYTALSGLTSHSQALTVTGNNIANVNTTAFKSSRVTFETQVAQTVSQSSAPDAQLGGKNSSQVGLGVRVGAITRIFTGGSLKPTGVNTDVAIEGNGFFVLNVSGNTRYSRDGSFLLDRDFNLVNSDGALVQGYGVDENFDVVQGVTNKISVPLGAMTVAEKTTKVQFAGNLNSGGDVATQGSLITSGPFTTGGAITPSVSGDALNGMQSTSGVPFVTGDVITITGVTKGGAVIPDKSFEIGVAGSTTTADTIGSTMGELLTFLDGILGLDSDNLAPGSPGVTIDGSGQIVIKGNFGEVNDIEFTATNMLINTGGAQNPMSPTMDKTVAANGESVRTTFVSFDSLGTPMTINISAVKEEEDSAGNTWRFFTQSEDDVSLDTVLGNGTITFDTNGKVVTTTNGQFFIDRSGTGAEPSQLITVDFSGPDGSVAQLADESSQIAAISQDGSPLGTLEDFSITEDGKITGVFSNSLLRTLGQLVLANFGNPAGLIETGSNMYNITVNSGSPQIVTPGTGGTGKTIGGALELSNVELSSEFIDLINVSTGFSANSRVMTTSDRLIQELLSVVR